MEKILKKYENNEIFQMLINILLVNSGARKATLIELNNFNDEEERANVKKEIDKWVKEYRLSTCKDFSSDKRFFITKKKVKTPETDDEIASLLGFLCIGHDFGNAEIIRRGGVIQVVNTVAYVYAEYCDASKVSEEELIRHLQQYVDTFNRSMGKYGLKYRFKYNVDLTYPLSYYIEKSSDKDFVRNNINKYMNILYNNYFEESVFLKDADLIFTYPDIFIIIMELIKNGSFEKFYKKIRDYTNDDHKKIMEAFKIFEKIILQKRNINISGV